MDTGGLRGASFRIAASAARRAFVSVPVSRRQWRLFKPSVLAAPRRRAQRGLASSGQHRSSSLGGASTSMIGFFDRRRLRFAGDFLMGSGALAGDRRLLRFSTWRQLSCESQWRIGGLRRARKMALASSAHGFSSASASGAAGAGSLGRSPRPCQP